MSFRDPKSISEPKTPFEKILISEFKEGMINYLNTHPEDFNEATHLAISTRQPYARRSAWLLIDCIEVNDERIKPHVDDIIRTIPTLKPNHQRELLRILQMMELTDDQEGSVLEISFQLWEKISLAPAIRYNALKFILQMVGKYPELKAELELVTQPEFLEPLSKGVRHSVKLMLEKLN